MLYFLFNPVNVKNFPSLSRMSGKVLTPAAYYCLYKQKNRFAADSDLMIIPQDLIFYLFLCPWCVLGYTIPSTETFSVEKRQEGSSGIKVVNEKLHLNRRATHTV